MTADVQFRPVPSKVIPNRCDASFEMTLRI